MAKIVLLKNRLGKRGGLEKHTFLIAKAFMEKGYSVTMLTSEDAGASFPFSQVVLKTIKWPLFLGIEEFDRKVEGWLEKNPADIVLGLDRNRFQTHLRAGNGVHASYLQIRSQIEGKLKTLCCKGNPLHRKILRIEKDGFENPRLKKLFTNSHMIKNEILRFYNVDQAKIEVIHNGVEWHQMKPAFSNWEEGKKAQAHSLGIKSDLFQILFIGNGFLRKGLDLLLRALAHLKEKNFFLSVIGKEKKIGKYISLVKELQLENNVRFFGPQQNILPFYQLGDALVIPSWYDPFANVTIEALAMGLPVISSTSNGGHEIITSENGLILKNLRDIPSFTASLEKMLLKPKNMVSASIIRDTVKHLDFSIQMTKFLGACF